MIARRAPVFASLTPHDGRLHVVARSGLGTRFRLWCDGQLAGDVDSQRLQAGYCFSPWRGAGAPLLLQLDALEQRRRWTTPIWQKTPMQDAAVKQSLWRLPQMGATACVLGTPRELRRIGVFAHWPAAGWAGARGLRLIVLDPDGDWQPETLPDLAALTRIDHLHVPACDPDRTREVLKALLAQTPPAFLLPLGPVSAAATVNLLLCPVVALTPFEPSIEKPCATIDPGATAAGIDSKTQSLTLRFDRKDVDQAHSARILLETWLGPWTPPLRGPAPSPTALTDRALRLAAGRPVVVLDDGQPGLDPVAQRFEALRFVALRYWQTERRSAAGAVAHAPLSAIRDSVVVCPSPDPALEAALFAWLGTRCIGYVSCFRAFMAQASQIGEVQ